MGISAKIWQIADEDIARCVAELTANVSPSAKHVNTLFHRVADEDCARVWGARAYHATLEALLAANIGLVVIDRSDPTYALDSASLRELLKRRDADDVVRALVEPEIPDVGGDQGGSIVDLMVRAVNAGRGVAFCIFEDW